MNPFEQLERFVERESKDVDAARVARGRRRFVAAVYGAKAPRTGRRWAVVALAFVATFGLLLWLGSARLSQKWFVLSGSAAPSAMRLEVPDDGPSSLELVPGTTAELSPGTLAFSSPAQAGRHRIELRRGKIRMAVDPGRHTPWTVAAGLYEVSVVGTLFSVQLVPESGAVTVEVERGRVQVSGGAARGERVTLEAGQKLRADPLRLEVTEDVKKIETAAAPPPPPEPAALEPTERKAKLESPPAPVTAEEPFAARYAARDYRGALQAAEQAGFERLLETLGRSQLAQLGDAARLAGNAPRCKQALQRLRARFPASNEAADAAFLLGRLQADVFSAPAAAAQWFERYLAERPSGGYAQEATGRLMAAARAAGDTAKARSVASRYLERYPTGPYSATARSILH